MKVLVLGLPRTGTTSLCAALRALGFKTYNYYEIFENQEKGHFQRWLSLIDAKLSGVGEPPKASDFDQILGGYDVVAASPCWMFVDELLAAYPTARVILTTRPPDVWLSSIKRTSSAVLKWRAWGVACLVDKFAALHWRLVNRVHCTLSQGQPPWERSADQPLLKFFEMHNNHVLEVVPRHQLLEFRPRDRWEPLCGILDIPVLRQRFPHSNTQDDFVEIEKKRYWILWAKLARLLVLMSGAAGVLLLFVLAVLRLN